MIISIITEECLCLQTLKHLINLIDTNNAEILRLYEELKDTQAEDWGVLTWGPLLAWEQHPLVQQPTLIMPPQPPNLPSANEE